MPVQFEIKTVLPASAKQVYEAWLDSRKHTEMTGGEASSSKKEGGKFKAWDGYLWGKNVSLTPGRQIVQTWRTSEFHKEDEDSLIEIELMDVDEGCQVFLRHSNIPEGQPDYELGWEEHYFMPMRAYFRASRSAY